MKNFNVKIKDEIVLVDYSDDEFGEVNHFEFHGKATSETGYKSLFVLKEEMKNETPKDFLLRILETDFGKGNVIIN
jgi:hypothetical protein